MFRLVILAAAALLFVTALWAEGADITSAKCAWPGPNRSDLQQYYLDGWKRDINGTVGGTYGRIRNQSPWVEAGTNYDGQRRFTAAWTMVAKPGNYWAQIGWNEYAYGERYTFVQVESGGLPYTAQYPPEPVNTETYYTTIYDPYPVPGHFSFTANGVQKGPWISTNWVPTNGQIFGEINILSNQMPGGTNWPLWLSDSNIYFNGAWQPFNGTPISSQFGYFPYWKQDSWTEAIWDSMCPD